MRASGNALRLLAAVPAVALAAVMAPAPAQAADRSLATVLTSDGNTFDRNAADFDVLTEAVLAVLEAKPNSPVKALTQAGTALTAFAPNDRAFRSLVTDLTGKRVPAEKQVFAAVAGLGIDTVETVLLYHVVPGAALASPKVLASDGATLTTAQGGSLIVRVEGSSVTLRDQDPDDTNPVVAAVDVNKGNRQIAHVIDRVLRPADL
ncbi:fasciclin domain-containing protein [Motilibacter aurantiacus]|uniref:fasciclin domain-containing protein n=1 Tax=Motilibacter aurantiacus TaxID=2714955 RepID=UPI00140CD5C5|nr:fasciclin domain-containing protein [Motilibacter aurantiacus]NHC46622.1 fasciclin domain-containing protein [Motilibacter aurantiacus]